MLLHVSQLSFLSTIQCLSCLSQDDCKVPKRKKKDVNAAEWPSPATESVQKPKPTAAKSKAKTKAKCKSGASAPASKPKVIKKPKSKARGKSACVKPSKPGASKKKETKENKQKKIRRRRTRTLCRLKMRSHRRPQSCIPQLESPGSAENLWWQKGCRQLACLQMKVW